MSSGTTPALPFIVERFANAELGGRMIELTMKGMALAAASAARPVSRKTAEKVLAEFLSRCETVNADLQYLYRVKKAAVFGSYARGATSLGDVDVYVMLEPKESDADRHEELSLATARAAEQAGRSSNGYFEFSGWSYQEVWLFLKSRKRTLSLSYADKWVLDDPGTEIVFDLERGGRVLRERG